MGESLRWFGAWRRTGGEVGAKREAYASNRGGRYQIRRSDEGFVVRYRRPYDLIDLSKLWDVIGTAATQEAAVTIAQAHNDQVEDDVVRCPHCLKVLLTRAGRPGLTAVERAKRLRERQLRHFAEMQRLRAGERWRRNGRRIRP